VSHRILVIFTVTRPRIADLAQVALHQRDIKVLVGIPLQIDMLPTETGIAAVPTKYRATKP
jgi:hypothetical protein